MSERQAWQVTDDAAVLYEQSFVPALFAGAAVQLVDGARIGAAERVLDVGCGTGVVAREAARRVGVDGRVAGLDLNPRMLEVARRLAPEITWHHGDAAALPFDDGELDVVVSQCMLMFLPDPIAGLREMCRVLAPGGRLAVAVCGPLAEAGGYGALVEVAEGVCTPAVVDLLRSPFALGDRARLAELAVAAGLGDTAVETLAWPVRFASIDALVHTEIGASPIRDVIEPGELEALLAGARHRLATWTGADGAIAFTMTGHVLNATKG